MTCEALGAQLERLEVCVRQQALLTQLPFRVVFGATHDKNNNKIRSRSTQPTPVEEARAGSSLDYERRQHISPLEDAPVHEPDVLNSYCVTLPTFNKKRHTQQTRAPAPPPPPPRTEAVAPIRDGREARATDWLRAQHLTQVAATDRRADKLEAAERQERRSAPSQPRFMPMVEARPPPRYARSLISDYRVPSHHLLDDILRERKPLSTSEHLRSVRQNVYKRSHVDCYRQLERVKYMHTAQRAHTVDYIPPHVDRDLLRPFSSRY